MKHSKKHPAHPSVGRADSITDQIGEISATQLLHAEGNIRLMEAAIRGGYYDEIPDWENVLANTLSHVATGLWLARARLEKLT